jgi:hypothetical protein
MSYSVNDQLLLIADFTIASIAARPLAYMIQLIFTKGLIEPLAILLYRNGYHFLDKVVFGDRLPDLLLNPTAESTSKNETINNPSPKSCHDDNHWDW